MEQQINLFGEEIAVPQTDTSKILNKINKPKKVSKKKKEITVQDKLNDINKLVNEELGIYKDQVMLITNKDELDDYIDQASKRTGIISIDTETNKVYACVKNENEIVDSWESLDDCFCSIFESFADSKLEYEFKSNR